MLLGTNILPGVVIRVKEIGLDASQTKRTYFFIQLMPPRENKCYSLDEFHEQEVDGQCQIVHASVDSVRMDLDQFINQVLSAMIFIPLESFIPSYVVTGDGRIIRHMMNCTNDDREKHGGIKNPLFYFTKALKNFEITEEDFQKQVAGKNFFEKFVRAMEVLISAQASDFVLESKDKKKYFSSLLQKA